MCYFMAYFARIGQLLELTDATRSYLREVIGVQISHQSKSAKNVSAELRSVHPLGEKN